MKMFWDSQEGPKVEILRPHEEVGSNVSTMGIGIWSIPEADFVRGPDPVDVCALG
jgi:hypothetical protein